MSKEVHEGWSRVRRRGPWQSTEMVVEKYSMHEDLVTFFQMEGVQCFRIAEMCVEMLILGHGIVVG